MAFEGLASESTNRLLRDFQAASKDWEKCCLNMADRITDVEQYRRITRNSRELVSRCILFDDPRSIISLLEQLEILLSIVQRDEAKLLRLAVRNLAKDFRKYGTL